MAENAVGRSRGSGRSENALAEALTVRARLHHARGGHPEAVRDEREAAEIWERPAVSEYRLASSLSALARYETSAGLGRLAHRTAERAITIWRQISVGLDRADKVPSGVAAVVGLAALIAPNLLPAKGAGVQATGPGSVAVGGDSSAPITTYVTGPPPDKTE
jgi:hypothetical protein